LLLILRRNYDIGKAGVIDKYYFANLLNNKRFYFSAVDYEGWYFDGLIDEAKIFNDSKAPVPEPSTLLLLDAGIARVGVFRKKFRK